MHTFNVIAWSIEALLVIALLAIGGDFVLYELNRRQKREHPKKIQAFKTALENAKAMLRREKERSAKQAEAEGGFFEESFTSMFDRTGTLIYRGYPTDGKTTLDTYKRLDALVDTEILTTAERF